MQLTAAHCGPSTSGRGPLLSAAFTTVSSRLYSHILPSRHRWKKFGEFETRAAISPVETDSSHMPSQNHDLPKTFQRLVARRTGESFRDVAEVEPAEMPVPGEGEVLIKVHYAGINGGCETFRARGEHWFARNKQLPWFALGAEGAGQVAAVGPGVQELAVGQHVTFVGGAFSEYVVAKAATCYPVPKATPEVVTLAISGLTAAAALHGTADIQPGETLLVTAAAGATGHLAVQLGLLAGCHVIATCGGARKAEQLRALGVHRVIDYTAEDIGAVLRREYPSGVNVIYEGVGGALHRTAFANLAPAGRMLQVGYISEYPHTTQQTAPGSGGQHAEPAAAGAAADVAQQQDDGQGGSKGREGEVGGAGGWEAGVELPPCSKLFWEGVKVEAPEGRTLYGQVWPSDRAKTMESKARLFRLHEEGKLSVWVDESAEFKGVGSIPQAVDHMLGGKCIGKVVVDLRD